MQQRVEILKALYRQAELLILDEPTAVLTPGEVEELFKTIKSLTAHGLSVIFITHKLEEVMAVCDRVTVLRDGRKVATVKVADTDTRALARMMVGREVFLTVEKPELPPGEVVLAVENVSAKDDRELAAVNNISFTVAATRCGHCRGRRQWPDGLAELITGLRRPRLGGSPCWARISPAPRRSKSSKRRWPTSRPIATKWGVPGPAHHRKLDRQGFWKWPFLQGRFLQAQGSRPLCRANNCQYSDSHTRP